MPAFAEDSAADPNVEATTGSSRVMQSADEMPTETPSTVEGDAGGAGAAIDGVEDPAGVVPGDDPPENTNAEVPPPISPSPEAPTAEVTDPQNPAENPDAGTPGTSAPSEEIEPQSPTQSGVADDSAQKQSVSESTTKKKAAGVIALAAPPGAQPKGTYQPSDDASNPSRWYSSGDPAQATELNSFTSSYTRTSENTWRLGATWTRPAATGTKGWSIEYTVAPESWGTGRGAEPVPQPDRSQGGIVLLIENSTGSSQTYTTRYCTYTSGNSYPGSCSSPLSGVLSSPDGGFTMVLDWQLPTSLTGSSGCPSQLGSTGYIRSWTGNRNIQAWAAPVAVDPPSSCGTTTLKITKIGDRKGSGMTNGLPVAGATYEAFASTSGSPGQPTGAPLGSCTTGADGTCTIPVSNANQSGAWVVEKSTPAGWRAIDTLGTGDYESTKTETPYRFRVAVGTGSQNVVRNVTADSNSPASNTVSGAWVNERVNPPFPQVCGISIAMVFDTSTSINSGEMTQFKTAAKQFVGANGLGGTPSRVSMFDFNTTAGTLNGGTAYDLAVPGSAGGNSGYLGAARMIDNGLPSQGNGYTNWDAALQNVNAWGKYDMVLMLTDGDPTTFGNGSTTSTNVQFRMVEQAVMSANAIKATTGPSGSKTKIVGVGVGLSTNSDLNLRAISGPTPGNDYFLASDFDELQETLQEIATKNCASTLTVVKQVQDADGNVKIANAAGWEFTGQSSAPGSVPAVQTTTDSGTNFPIVFPEAGTLQFTVQETPKPGYTFVGATCTDAAGAVVPGQNGFTVPVRNALITKCTVVNREVRPEAELTLVKKVVNAHGGTSKVSDWTLSATGGTNISGKTGDDSVTKATVTPGEYALDESGPAGYRASAWTCLDGKTELEVAEGHVVDLSDGAAVTCTIANSDLPGAVAWTKVSKHDEELLEGAEWNITGPGMGASGTTIPDCTAVPCSGPDVNPAAGEFELEDLSWGDYTVRETKAPPGYTGGAEFTFSVTAENAGSVIDQGAIVNEQQTPVPIPLTGGIGAHLFALGGLCLGVLAILTAIVAHRVRSLRRRISTSITTNP